jgi:hypothetical protein
VSLSFRRFRYAARLRALSKAVSKGLSACFDASLRSRSAFVTVFAGRKEIEYAVCKNNVPKATLSLREPTKQLQYVTVCSGLFWFRSKSRTGRTSVLLLHRVYLLPACLLQVDGATSGRTDFQEEQTFKKSTKTKELRRFASLPVYNR